MIQPEYPRAEAFIRAAGYHKDPDRRVTRIVLHITSGGPNADRTAAWFAAGADGKHSSAHFVVGNDGTIVQCVSLADVAYHAHAANSYSVGIEHCAREPHELGPNDPGLRVTEDQYQASAQLVAWLCDRYHLGRDRVHILGHREADPSTTHTGCPDAAPWDWVRYMAMVQAVPSTQAA